MVFLADQHQTGGILDDAQPFEKLGFWMESQSGLQDL